MNLTADCQRSHFARQQSGFNNRWDERKQKSHPLVDGEFLKIKRSEFELDPSGNCGQPSIWSVTHCVLFFGVCKYTLNCLRAQSICLFADRREPDIFCLLDVIMPDMSGYGLYALLILSALFSDRTVLADISLALVFPVAFTIRRCITQHLVLRTDHTIIVAKNNYPFRKEIIPTESVT